MKVVEYLCHSFVGDFLDGNSVVDLGGNMGFCCIPFPIKNNGNILFINKNLISKYQNFYLKYFVRYLMAIKRVIKRLLKK